MSLAEDFRPELAPLFAALSAFQGAVANPVKDLTAKVVSDKGKYEYNYADLSQVWDCIRDPLAANGLSIVQRLEEITRPGEEKVRTVTKWTDANGVEGEEVKESAETLYLMVLVTELWHSSGGVVRSRMWVRAVKDTPQGWGAAIAYVRRYGLNAILGIAPEREDDDAISHENVTATIERRGSRRAPAPAEKAESERPASTAGKPMSASQKGKLLALIKTFCTYGEPFLEWALTVQYIAKDDVFAWNKISFEQANHMVELLGDPARRAKALERYEKLLAHVTAEESNGAEGSSSAEG